MPTRPALNPALRRLWRLDGGLQLGIDPRRAVVIEGLAGPDEPLLSLLDGSRDLEQAAALAGTTTQRAEEVVGALRLAGALSPGPVDQAAIPERLVPDALCAGLLRPERPGTATILRRSLRRVDVLGAGRVGATLAALLAGSAVGDVRCVDEGTLRPGDLAPGGLRRVSARTRGAAVRQLLSRMSSWADVPAPDGRAEPDLVVLAPARPITPPELAAQARTASHLEVVVRETTAAVGPLVLPGRTPCRRCAELARADRDPQWPWIAAQLAGPSRRTDACDLGLATLAAALTAVHVLRWLDDLGPDPRPHEHPLAGSIAEVSLLDLTVRHRAVSAHPRCGCGAG